MRKLVALALVGLSGVFSVGCGSGRDVEVTGEVSAPASVSVQGPILLDFLEIPGDNETPESVHTENLAMLGAFTATASVEGDKVRIRAIDDRDDNGACTAGEAWAEVDADVSADDKVTGVKLELANRDCPAPAAM
jgi:hypothetical protein